MICKILALTTLSAMLYALTWWSVGWGFSPDGVQYEQMALGKRVPAPYSRRIALPWLLARLGPPLSLRLRWIRWGAVWTVLSAVVTALYVGGSLERMALAVVLFAGLPGIWRLNVRLPILVDPTAYTLCVLSAILYRQDSAFCWVNATLILMIGAAVKETVPLFVAALALQPFALIGLALPIALHRTTPTTPTTEPYLTHPVREARKVHDWFDWKSKLLPWGVLIVLAPLGFMWDRPGVCMLITLTLGYGQLTAAQDNARLFQWAAPAVLAVALANPPGWVWPIALLGLFNPYRGT